MSFDPEEAYYKSSMLGLSDGQTSRGETPHDELVTADAITRNTNYVKEEFDDDDGSTAENSSDSEEVCSDDSEDNSQDTAPEELPIDIIEEKPNIKIPDKWPTLEILPGGVIKPTAEDTHSSSNKLCMYACAKCPQTFKELFSLTKHIRTHKDENRRKEGVDLCKLGNVERELLSLRRSRLEEERKYRKRKIEVMARIGSAMVNVDKKVFL